MTAPTAPTTTAPGDGAAATGSLADDRLRAALGSRARPPRPSPLTASLAFGWRAMLKIKHVPEQLFDVTAFPVMMTLMFTFLFGGAVSGSTREYVQYVLPGLLVMNVSMITMYTGTALNRDIEKGVFDRFRSLPIWRPAVIVGALFGDVVRYSVASVVILTVGMILGYRPEGGPVGLLLAVGLLLVFCFSLAWLWTALGLKMKTPESLMGASMMVLFPLTFLSNVLVQPETLPGWLQAFVRVNPISLLVTAVRGLASGQPVASDVAAVLIVSAALTAIFGPITMRLFAKPR